ncbi:MAG: OsmC family protein [Rhodoferax sp.]|nr:OsmC family protein [Rhodoferax sp.]MCB2028989.1 OsmC family protein [Rhodoferax sp.]MCB2042422.1 OsmC family protein [Rhodoferax sp.]
MHVKIKPKTYGPLTVQSSDAGALTFETEAGHHAAGALAPASDAMSPSDLMLAALANCIAISMRMASEQMRLELGALNVSATVTKATDLPNRFGRFDVVVRAASPVDGARVEELLKRTKDICTVSNTLGADVALRLDT